MKYFLIEINKPFLKGKAYQNELQRRIANCEFEVVAVGNSHDEIVKENSRFIVANICNQSHKHYETIEGDGESGLIGLQSKIDQFYKNLSK